MITTSKSKTGEIRIYDEIGFFGISPETISKQLDEMGDVSQINVRIDSPGGDVFAGVAIHSLLTRHLAKVIVSVDGLAASIAAFLLDAGDEVEITENAMIMLHRSWSVTVGDVAEHKKTIGVLSKIDDMLINTFSRRTGKSRAGIEAILDAETWLDANEAIELGLVDRKVESRQSAKFTRRDYTSARRRWDNQSPQSWKSAERKLKLIEMDGHFWDEQPTATSTRRDRERQLARQDREIKLDAMTTY